MNLLRALKEGDFSWTIHPGVHTGAVRMTMTNPNGNSVSKEVSPYNLEKGRDPITVLAVNCLRAMEPRPELLSKWFEAHGNYRARVIPGTDLRDGSSVYYETHVALRKLMDGPESVILWNGYHVLDEETCKLYMEFLKGRFAAVHERPDRDVSNLRTFCDIFRNDVAEFFNDRALSVRRGETPIPEDLRQLYQTLLYSMATAFKNLSGDDYAFGFFGYVFERFPDE